MSKDIKNNNEIISFEEEENVNNIQNKSKKDNIDIEQILKKEDELLKQNKKKIRTKKISKYRKILKI